MSKARNDILLIGLTILALSAGVVAGMLVSRLPTPGPGGEMPMRTPLEEALQLSPQQRDEMKKIWEGVRSRGHECFEDAQQLTKGRDDALVALLTAEQKAQFEKISKEYAQRFADLEQKREHAFADAVDRTKKLLNDEQRQKYEKILKERVGHGPASGMMGGMTPPPPGTGTSCPTP